MDFTNGAWIGIDEAEANIHVSPHVIQFSEYYTTMNNLAFPPFVLKPRYDFYIPDLSL